MDLSRAVSHISHFKLLQSKLKSLDVELKEAMSNEKEIVKETQQLETKLKENADEFEHKRTDMEKAFAEKIEEYVKQVRFFEELLHKKTEERDQQLAYLNELNVCEKSHDDLVEFDWSTLKKIAGNGDKNDILTKQYQKALETKVLSDEAQMKLEKLFKLLNSTEDARYGVLTEIAKINGYITKWKDQADRQQKTLSLHETENYRLTLIIKQCISNNEPMSENITRNVRDKCHSFINSSNDEELIQGLKKYHKRQENTIKLLKRKANKLSHELSHLEVASDQTADLIQHYLTMIHANSNMLLVHNPTIRTRAPQNV